MFLANRMDTETFMDRFADKIDELDHEEQLILSEIVPAIKQVLPTKTAFMKFTLRG